MTAHDSEILKEGQQVLTACAFIHQKFDGVEKVFLPRRAHTKKFLPDVFELPGGHIDFGETFQEGLAREIFEEFKMNVRIGDLIDAFTYTNPIKKSHSAELVYFATFVTSLDEISLDPADHSEFRWVSRDELQDIYSNQKNEQDPEFVIVQKAFDMLGGSRLNFGESVA